MCETAPEAVAAPQALVLKPRKGGATRRQIRGVGPFRFRISDIWSSWRASQASRPDRSKAAKSCSAACPFIDLRASATSWRQCSASTVCSPASAIRTPRTMVATSFPNSRQPCQGWVCGYPCRLPAVSVRGLSKVRHGSWRARKDSNVRSSDSGFTGPGLRVPRNPDEGRAETLPRLVPAVGHPVVAAQVAGFDDAVVAGPGGAPRAQGEAREA